MARLWCIWMRGSNFVRCLPVARLITYRIMVNATILSQVKSLSPEDRLELIGAVWETLSPLDVPVTDEEKALIDSRLQEMEAHPDDQSPWQDAAVRLRHQLR